MYFDKPGKGNTIATLNEAYERGRELGKNDSPQRGQGR